MTIENWGEKEKNVMACSGCPPVWNHVARSVTVTPTPFAVQLLVHAWLSAGLGFNGHMALIQLVPLCCQCCPTLDNLVEQGLGMPVCCSPFDLLQPLSIFGVVGTWLMLRFRPWDNLLPWIDGLGRLLTTHPTSEAALSTFTCMFISSHLSVSLNLSCSVVPSLFI
jgi:hypothetical protein